MKGKLLKIDERGEINAYINDILKRREYSSKAKLFSPNYEQP